MFKHINDSKEAATFFEANGIKVINASHNSITLVDGDGVELAIYVESESCVAAGIPGIYVDEKIQMTLLETLRAIEACDEIVSVIPDEIKNNDGSYDPDDLHPLIRQAEYLANVELINKGGSCKWSEHKKLESEGFPVRKGESDSFGWLTGLIVTSKGKIMYG